MLEESVPEILRTRSADMFRLLVDSVMDYAIFVLDPGGYIQSWNEGARRIKGYEADEIIGQHFSIFYPPHEVRRGKPDYGLRVAADEGHWEDEGWRVRKDGSRFWASVVITALRGADGALVGFVKVTRDLTERRRAEEERMRLLEMERAARAEAESSLARLQAIQRVTEAALGHLSLDELLATLLDRVAEILEIDTVAILLLDEQERVLEACAARGIEEEVERGVRIPIGYGFAGRIVSEQRPIVLNDVAHSAVLNPILREKGIRSLMGVPLRVDGKIIGVLHVGTLFARHFREDDQQFLQVAADRVALAIEHARLFASAERARQEADTSAARLQAQDEFLSIAAHELKTPMTSVKAAVQLLMRRTARTGISLPPEIARSIATIDEQTDKLARLTDQLLTTARLQANRLPLDRQPTDVASLTRAVVARFEDNVPGSRLLVAGPGALWAEVDPLRLEQVLANLLDNALKFSDPGAPIEIAMAHPHPRRIEVTVRDHGPGVAEDQRARLFERFYQASGEHARRGLGLGLYISRQIVEQHGGMITADFPSDGGSRFVVVLPIDAHEGDPA